jgi:Polyketide cyclase / dehydrase and lipid transport
MRGEVETYVEAPADLVYALVSDVTRMGEWTPETYRCVWTRGATGPAVGARFKARNRRGMLRWRNTPVVLVADPGREFTFRRRMLGNEVDWQYRMEPQGSGTRLSESFVMSTPSPAAANWVVLRLMGVADRQADLVQGMRQTLDRLRAAAEATAAAR